MNRNFALGNLLLLALSAAMVPIAQAATIHVNNAIGDDTWDGRCDTWDGDTCGPKATIQAGIDAANPDDEVVVADGTYTGDGNRNLDFGGKLITVRSENGPGACTIDCERDECDGEDYCWLRGFHFHSGETADATVDGFTIRNGYASYPDGGGGVCCDGSSPTFNNCTISGNMAHHWRGGGVSCSNGSNPTFTNCTISGNTAQSYGDGGGFYCDCGSPVLINCTIAANSSGRGGAFFCLHSSPILINCTITASWTFEDGGGVYCIDGSRPTFTNCTISENRASGGRGGGIFCVEFSSPTLTNCTVTGNSADAGGGVCCVGYSNPTLINCTITGNSADVGEGGGVYCDGESNPTLTNCILWGDTQQEIRVDSGSLPVVTYCDVQGGWPGTGNIDADPLFIDPDGPDDDSNTWQDNDHRLRPDSPCIDAGDNAAVPSDTPDLDSDGDTAEPLPLDLDANPRFLDAAAATDSGTGTPPIVDMGAYELGMGDFDGDGVLDHEDGCPTDPNKIEPGVCGCGVPDTDTDGDGVADCNDGCPDDPNKSEPGACGCGVPDTDTDGDGTADCIDGCPDDPNKIEPGVCGCGASDTDRDGDGVPDCNDGCPDDPDKTEPGICGCGVPEDACGDSQLPIPGIFCPAAATLMLTLTLLALMRMRERATTARGRTK